MFVGWLSYNTPHSCVLLRSVLLHAIHLWVRILVSFIRELLTNVASCLLFASYKALDFSLGQYLELFIWSTV